MEQATGQKVLIIYQSRSDGRHTVTGPATKTAYGYRRRGDKFEVYEADMRTRPDLFRPANPAPAPQRIVARRGGREAPVGQPVPATIPAGAPPPPPTPLGKMYPVTAAEVEAAKPVLPDDKLLWPLAELDWSGTRVNSGHLGLLAEEGIKRLKDLEKTNEAGLLAINGIGEATVLALYAQEAKYK